MIYLLTEAVVKVEYNQSCLLIPVTHLYVYDYVQSIQENNGQWTTMHLELWAI